MWAECYGSSGGNLPKLRWSAVNKATATPFISFFIDDLPLSLKK
jgi:hypothetical protein